MSFTPERVLNKLTYLLTYSKFCVNNETISDQRTIAKAFNNLFANIGKNTTDNVPPTPIPFTDYLNTPFPSSMYVDPVSPHEVLEIVTKLKPKTSFGHDLIPMKVVTNYIINILPVLTHISNKSLLSGTFPSKLKLAKVVPVYKSSDCTQLNNYRPISLLPAFSKIFEIIVFNKIMAFTNRNKLFYSHQYGFRPKHSTIHPILHLLNDCAEASNSNPIQITIAILCDLSKAFHVINRDILIAKLDYYGLRGLIKDWLISYLSNRTQFVSINNNQSDYLSVDCGVPQGSILGPLLYLIYVNDISNSITQGKILSFADDTSLYLSDNDLENLNHDANTEINNLYNWFCANKLSLNPTKTKYVHIKPPRSRIAAYKCLIKIRGVELEQIGHQFLKTAQNL